MAKKKGGSKNGRDDVLFRGLCPPGQREEEVKYRSCWVVFAQYGVDPENKGEKKPRRKKKRKGGGKREERPVNLEGLRGFLRRARGEGEERNGKRGERAGPRLFF